AQSPRADELRGRLLRFAEEGEGSAAEPNALRLGQGDQLPGLVVARGQWLFAEDVFARFQAGARNLVMGLEDGQVDDQVHAVAGEQLAQAREGAAAMLPGGGLGPAGVEGEAAGDRYDIRMALEVAEV